ncbi:UNVERIFIED_CONTAM: hypothetical protein GTU68_015852 [Idotea baltica]|nr:hypothetical protein [Idotea baltica]
MFRGEIVEFKDATISISNTAFMYGLSVFTGMRAHYNEDQERLYLFRPKEHFERFCFQCKLIRYDNFFENYDYDRFLSLMLELLRVNEIKQDAYIRVTNFTDENKVTPKFIDYKDSLCAFLYPIGNYVPTTGMRCKVASWQRVSDNSVPARAKISGLYVNTGFAKNEALTHGYDEALFLNEHGNVVEGSAENIFIVYGNTLVTPPKSDAILEGITRQTVMEVAADKGLKVEERSIARSELYRADEIFLTGTGAQVSPVIQVDGYDVGSGAIGPVSQDLQETYFKIVRGQLPEYASWLVNVYDDQ